ncbi:DUF6906 family protein [Salipaludibacillus aurantiacus]|uniref:DUF6906 domain-containing protein n=1 Tax=Salipaludibacillus aurantiacus TaxID=1601833 RepID=A0A1H9U1L8_9BACI|nr:hypothetical protein SAMN05518684_106227 [Salipaludibacillus aurantiacus]
MKKPTRSQKEAITWAGLNIDDWQVKKVRPDSLVVKHRWVGREKEIPI